MYDVVIIGAGPAGSRVAYRLADAGYSVLVLERKRRLGEPVCCTGIVGPGCVSTFPVDERVILRRVNSASLFSPNGESIIRLKRDKTQAYVLDRALFDVAMAEKAQRCGARYLLNSQVTSVESSDDSVEVKADCGVEHLSFKGRATVIASGFGSKVAVQSGFARPRDFVVGAQARVQTKDLNEIEVYSGGEISPVFFAWLVPTSSGQALAGLLSRKYAGEYLRKLLQSLAGQGKIASAEVDLSYRGIPLEALPRTYGRRLLVVGDAAGQVRPTNGGGIYYSLLCADAAADTLCLALKKNDLSAGSLASYQRRWKKIIGRELRIGSWVRKIYEHLSDNQIERAFAIMSGDIRELLLRNPDLSIDWHGPIILRLLWRWPLNSLITMAKSPFAKAGKYTID